MDNIIKKYDFNRLCFCYDCFNHVEIDESTFFLFYNSSNGLVYRYKMEELKTPLTKGFTPHIFRCLSYNERMNYLKYVCICGICNLEFADATLGKISFEKTLESLSTINRWNDLANSVHTF